MRRLVAVCWVLPIMVLSACGNRSPSEAVEQFASAFNEGTLAEQKGLFEPRPSKAQLQTLTELGNSCTIDSGSIAVAEGVMTPFRRTFGAVAECGGSRLAVISKVNKDCGTDTAGCSTDYRISPVGLPGGEQVGKVNGERLPETITDLDPLSSR